MQEVVDIAVSPTSRPDRRQIAIVIGGGNIFRAQFTAGNSSIEAPPTTWVCRHGDQRPRITRPLNHLNCQTAYVRTAHGRRRRHSFAAAHDAISKAASSSPAAPPWFVTTDTAAAQSHGDQADILMKAIIASTASSRRPRKDPSATLTTHLQRSPRPHHE
jgi:uridylate kinase